MNDATFTAIRIIIGLLVEGSYDVVEAMTRSRRLSSNTLRSIIKTYGQTLVMTPDENIRAIDVVTVTGSSPVELLAAVDLWTEQDGRSDLTLELRLTDLYSGAYDIEIMDLHVL